MSKNMTEENRERINFTTWFLVALTILSGCFYVAAFIVLPENRHRVQLLEIVNVLFGLGGAMSIIIAVAAVLSWWQKVGKRNRTCREWTALAAFTIFLIYLFFTPAMYN